MDYPIWELALGGGMLMAIVAIAALGIEAVRGTRSAGI